MNISEPQKDLIRQINSREISDLQSFQIKYYGDVEKILEKESDVFTSHIITGSGFKVLIPRYNTEEYNKLIDFIICWNTLEKNNLILVFQRISKERLGIGFANKFKDDFNNDSVKLIDILKEYGSKIIITTPELDEFVSNEFVTFEERKYQSEKRHRFWAQLITISIAIISMVISTLNLISQQNYNKKAFERDNKITISNPVSLPDTFNVKISNQVKLK